MKRHTSDLGPLDVLISSPKNDRSIILEYFGEVPFGPPYFALWIEHQGNFVGSSTRDFYGDKAFWSHDGRYLALERWLSLEVPDNCLLILDLILARQCLAARLRMKFLHDVIWHPTESESHRLITYQAEWFGDNGEPLRTTTKLVIDDRLDWTSANWLTEF